MSRAILPTLLLLAVAVVALLGLTGTSRAAEQGVELRFVSLSGEGSATKAWFEGAPPTGTRVQEALDKFAREGYRFAGLEPTFRQSQIQQNNLGANASAPSLPSTPEPTFVLILERVLVPR